MINTNWEEKKVRGFMLFTESHNRNTWSDELRSLLDSQRAELEKKADIECADHEIAYREKCRAELVSRTEKMISGCKYNHHAPHNCSFLQVDTVLKRVLALLVPDGKETGV